MTDENPVPPYVEPPQNPEPPLEAPVPPEIPYVAPPMPTFESTPPYAPAPPVSSATLTGTETILVVIGSLLTTWIVPLVLWLVWKDTEPEKARQAVKIGVLVAVVGALLWCCVVGAAVFGTAALTSSSSSVYY